MNNALKWYSLFLLGFTGLSLFIDYIDGIDPGISIGAIILFSPVAYYIAARSNPKDNDIN